MTGGKKQLPKYVQSKFDRVGLVLAEAERELDEPLSTSTLEGRLSPSDPPEDEDAQGG